MQERRVIYIITGLISILLHSAAVFASDRVRAYELIYDEQEPGTGIYRNRYLVTDAYLRIDEVDERSGFILFDSKKGVIYSVSHDDRSILVINNENYVRPDMRNTVSISYDSLPEAPAIEGKAVYNYRVATTGAEADVCMDIQLVAGLLPEVSKMLRAYQQVVASQQVRVLNNTPQEFRTACFLYDQVYNNGQYYEKGLPIQEWHSNNRKKLLSSYKAVDVDPELFAVSDEYRQYSIK